LERFARFPLTLERSSWFTLALRRTHGSGDSIKVAFYGSGVVLAAAFELAEQHHMETTEGSQVTFLRLWRGLGGFI